uniref:NRF domain-containing protein n=1 Tax=Macrostomum lignano TaxID=282301 RepID=A0A1I8IP37_9PLAT
MILKLSAASSLSLAALLLLLPLLAAAAGGEVSYNSFWRRLDSFRPVADAADGGVSRPTLEAAARLLSADGASLRQAALEALETFVRAEQAAASFAVASDGNESISACANHTVTLLMALSKGEGWALKFLDSDAKPPAALAYGARLWLGNYDQCMAVGRSDPIEIYGAADEHRSDPLPIRGSYCLLAAAETGGSGRPAGGLESSALRLGLCWPDSCSPAQINNLTQLLLSPLQKLLPANRSLLVLPQATQCHQPRAQLPWTRAAVFMTCLLSLFGGFMLLGTAFDLVRTYRLSWRSLCRSRKQLLVNEDEEADAETATADGISAAAADGGGHLVNGIANGGHETASSFSAIAADRLPLPLRLLLCFSVLTNARKIADVSHSEGTLTCVHGLRFLSMSWVILGHTYYFAFGSLNNMGQLYAGWQNDWTFQVIANATVSVDSFFVLSGLLSTYLFFRELQRMGGGLRKINWLMFYVHRYWRLTPPYLLVMATYVSLFQYVYEGPMYPQAPAAIDPQCPTDWWKNALYINNLFSAESGAGCMGWSWYLANDMQFYIVSPLLFCLLAIKPALGVGVTSALLLASVTAMGIHSTVNGLAVGFFGIAQEFSGIYIKPWFRATPYLVGVLSGYLLHRLKERRWRPNRLLVALLWLVAAGVALSIVYGLYDVDGGRVKLSQNVASLYNAVYRPLWAAAVAWVTIACVTGNGGWVNSLLSQPLFAPLSRLTYCAYLVHPVVMLAYYLSRRQAMVWDNFSVIHAFLGNCALAYMAAFVASL